MRVINYLIAVDCSSFRDQHDYSQMKIFGIYLSRSVLHTGAELRLSCREVVCDRAELIGLQSSARA